MMKTIHVVLSVVVLVVFSELAWAEPPKGFNSLDWLAGTRYISRDDGSKSYETWTGPSGGRISGAVATGSNGGMVEFLWIGPNEQGVYGLSTANSNTGLTTWRFLPLKSIEPGKIIFAAADGSRSFSIESVKDGAIHNVSLRVVDGKTVKQEWLWLSLPSGK
jgi:hypothetical protein